MVSQRLHGQVALVTGGSRGIGRAVALQLADEGAAVAVNYLNRPDAAEEVVDQIRSAGGQALAARADVAVLADVRSMVERAASDLGPIDILVNNAGLLFPGRLLDYRVDEFDQMWRTNVKGTLFCCEAVAPAMIERGRGRIVNISSNAAIGNAMPGSTLYAATKGAVLTLTKRLALELGPSGVTVNAVLPGFTRTDMTLGGKEPDEARRVEEKFSAAAVLGRVGDPREIARAVAFLASDDASFITGQFLLADGGRMDYFAQC